MARRYILHGGAGRKVPAGYKAYFREILIRLKREPMVLLVYFSRPKEEWQNLFEQDRKEFVEYCPEWKINFILASEEPGEFRKQIAVSDAIYVRGGSDVLLQDVVKSIPDFTALIKDKVYAGSSAGMNLVAKYYFSSERKRVEKGLGVLPIKVIAHWNGSNINDLHMLEQHGESLKIYRVPEAEFVIIE